MAVNLILNLALIPTIGHMGPPLATALASSVNVWLLYRTLRRRGQFVPDAQLRRRTLRLAAAAALMGGVLWFLANRFAPYTTGPTLDRWGAMFVLVTFGGLVYGLAALMFGAFHLRDIGRFVRRGSREVR